MTNTKKPVPTIKADLELGLAQLTTTSAKIRYLTAEGLSRGDIGRLLGIRYQWVRNVQLTPLKNG